MLTVYAVCGVILLLLFTIVKFWRHCIHKPHYDVPAYTTRGHHWCFIDVFPQPTYCCLTEVHIVQGVYCDYCGVCVSNELAKEADKKLKCKELTSYGDVSVHHWIKGNLPLCSTCDVCSNSCGILPKLSDLRCCWCQRTVHDSCIYQVERMCDLGSNRTMIIPSRCVQIKPLRGLKKRSVVSHVQNPRIASWQPLIVIANKESGNYDGNNLLQMFRFLVNPLQVIDIHNIKPECGLEWCHLLPDTRWRVLVCGGDGTIGWVLSAIDILDLKLTPEVAVLPLGTGNDLSRVLGWGPGYTGDVDVNNYLSKVRYAKTVHLDRWKVMIIQPKRFHLVQMKKSLVMNSYISVGVDALVCLNFHRQRKSRPHLFGSRIFNKIWYVHYGTRDVLERECKNLHKNILLELDGKRVNLPELEGIVILNISSWGGGCQPWSIQADDSSTVSRFDDGLLEVMGIYSSFHCAQMQVGLAEPLRIGQARTIKMTILSKMPMQVDGEPWEQSMSEVTITHHNTARMLYNDTSEEFDI